MTTRQKRKGSRLEDRVTSDAVKAGLPAKKQPGSGVYKDFPNDVDLGRLLGECKCGYTTVQVKGGRVFHFRLDWLEGAIKNARASGFDSGVVFFRPDGTTKYYALMEGPDFLDQFTRNCVNS